MKISINSTFSYIKFNLNYGSALQCYALQRYLKKRGHDASHIRDYRANPVILIKRLKYIRYPRLFFAKINGLKKLQRFIKEQLSLSERGYSSYSAMKRRCPNADCHIAGSDQIWHNDHNFRYLTYVPDGVLKLSYAASFGAAGIPKSMKETIKPYLERFDGISVRETSGVEIVNSMGLDAVQLPDPTLLLDKDEYPIKSVDKKDYFYCYFLNLPSKEAVPFQAIKKIAAEHEKELLVTAPLNYPLFSDENQCFPSVEEWLGLYDGADVIFTNTFHGLLFCIIFEKNFVLFTQNNKENERFYSILKLLGLEDRMISPNEFEKIPTILSTTIDYIRVRDLISKERKKADAFFSGFGL